MNNPKTRDDDERSSIANQRGLGGQDKQQSDLRNPAAEPPETPEGLLRPRRGPLDNNLGRAGLGRGDGQ